MIPRGIAVGAILSYLVSLNQPKDVEERRDNMEQHSQQCARGLNLDRVLVIWILDGQEPSFRQATTSGLYVIFDQP